MNMNTNDDDLLAGADDATSLLDTGKTEAAAKPEVKAKAPRKKYPKKPKAEKKDDAEALLAGAEPNVIKMPKPKKPSASDSKKDATAKPAKPSGKSSKKPASPAVKKAAPVKKEKAVAAKKPKADKKPVKAKKEKKPDSPPRHQKPTLSLQQVSVLAFFAGVKNRWTTQALVAKACTGKTDATINDEFLTSYVKPMIRKGILELDKPSDQLRPVPDQFTMRSKDVLRLIQKVPTDPEKGLSAGRIGGKVWGKKDDEWLNVRFGRAAGAQLHTLAKVGAVGFTQASPSKPVLWYRLAPAAE
jgi:hypothetical protein